MFDLLLILFMGVRMWLRLKGVEIGPREDKVDIVVIGKLKETEDCVNILVENSEVGIEDIIEDTFWKISFW